jgi:hypothetical protein
MTSHIFAILRQSCIDNHSPVAGFWNISPHPSISGSDPLAVSPWSLKTALPSQISPDQIPLSSDFSTNVSVKLASRIADENEGRKKMGIILSISLEDMGQRKIFSKS